MSKVKICGLTRLEDIYSVNVAKPDYIGFIFAESRRQISPKIANVLSRVLSPNIVPVGVFVDAPIDQISGLVQAGTIRAVQLHGREDSCYIARLRQQVTVPVIKGIHVTEVADVLFGQNLGANYLLLDNGGGTGQAFDWRRIPSGIKPYFLAGGIDLENLGEALALGPYCIDISSGAETQGVKNAAKIKALVEQVRQDSRDHGQGTI